MKLGKGRIENFLFLGLALLLFSGCGDFTDYYSQVSEVCNYQFPTGSSYPNRVPEIDRTNAIEKPEHAECKAALARLIPADANLINAPRNMYNHILEAFQVLVGYPLTLPERFQFLSVPFSFPADVQCVVAPQLNEHCLSNPYPWAFNLNQNIFNWILNIVRTISYEESVFNDDGGDARFENRGARLVIRRNLIPESAGDTSYLTNPFVRAGVLVHEIYHATGTHHSYCTGATAELNGFSCDNDLGGAVGIQLLYTAALLRSYATGVIPLASINFKDTTVLTRNLCRDFVTKINDLSTRPEYAAGLPTDGSCVYYGVKEYFRAEGI